MTLLLDKKTCDLIKFVSAMMVALHHFSQYVLANGLSSNLFFRVFSSQGGYLGVAVFFFLSGYGLMESESKHHLSLQAFFRKRFLKIYLPVLLVTALWLPAARLALNFEGGGNSFFYVLFLGFGDAVLWFVKILFLLYGAFYLYAWIAVKSPRRLALSVLGLLVLMIFIYCNNRFGAFSVISIPLFYVGVIASLNKDFSRSVLLPASLLVSALFTFAWSAFIADSLPLSLHALINHVVLAILIALFSVYTIRINTPALLGIVAFDVYLVHNKVLMLLKTHPLMESSPFVFLGCFALLTVLATLCFYSIRKFLKI